MHKAQSAFVASTPVAIRKRAFSLCRALRPYTLPPSHRTIRPQTTLPLRRLNPVASVKPQQETPWNRVKVVENSFNCEGHRYIVVNVGVSSEKGTLIDSYRVPGMFVQMRASPEEKPSFFAISCAPNVAGYFEFLVKESEYSKSICDVKEGNTVEMSPVMGKGFPMSKLNMADYDEEHKPKDILLFATGSGIAPIRAAIESPLNGLNVPLRRSVKLFYGARYPNRMPYMERFGMWQVDGVEIIPVMSRPQDAFDKWDGETGYIQDMLKKVGVDNPDQTAALLCGVKGMTEDVTSLLTEAGVPKDRILLNF
ncbi:Oxidoreductase NAD-binding [Gracilaria domingensis]|nr:Oxidoreductase NAD-binding [Gracilaria domingensis]